MFGVEKKWADRMGRRSMRDLRSRLRPSNNGFIDVSELVASFVLFGVLFLSRRNVSKDAFSTREKNKSFPERMLL
jgi:hypothetical protein